MATKTKRKVARLATADGSPAIPEQLWKPLHAAVVNAGSAGDALRDAVLTFGRTLPKHYRSAPIPAAVAMAHADAACDELETKLLTPGMSAAEIASVKSTIKTKRSRTASLYTSAGLLATAWEQGAVRGGVSELSLFATALKRSDYNIQRAVESLKTKAEKESDGDTDTVRGARAILGAKGKTPRQSPHCKAHFVAFCDLWDIKVPGMDEYRNVTLANKPRKA